MPRGNPPSQARNSTHRTRRKAPAEKVGAFLLMGKMDLQRTIGKFLRRAQPPEGEPEEQIEEVQEIVEEHEEVLSEHEEKMDDLEDDALPPEVIEEDSVVKEVRELRRQLEEMLESQHGTQEAITNMMDLIVETNPSLMDRRIEKMKERVRPDSTITEQEFGIMSPGYY